jgi:hypothetical protein
VAFLERVSKPLGTNSESDRKLMETVALMKKDFEILPKRTGKGRYMGTVIGVRNRHPRKWWGEGEVKMHIDGDTPIFAETEDDWSCATFGYEPIPSDALPEMPSIGERCSDLEGLGGIGQ